MNTDRHRKQVLFPGLGPAGQAALGRSSVLVAGCGATGGTIAALLVRAGVGLVRVVDRDFPELGNLGRQLLYNEPDLLEGLPKAVLAERSLSRANSEVKVQGIVADLNPDNVLELIRDVDLIMDGLDNQETRYLINDAAVNLGKPWVYAGCLGAAGNVMVILPGRTPCLRCLFPHPAPPGVLPTCDTAGIIGPAASLTASLASAEALKLLALGTEDIKPRMIAFDAWGGSFREISLAAEPDRSCPCCGQLRFEFLLGARRTTSETLCGVDAVQVNSPGRMKAALSALAARLEPGAIISCNEFLLRFRAEGLEFAVFPDGRVIVHGTSDQAVARSAAGRYLGF
ncbi:MAG: ThiF family adenylyltransferase [Thermodesulfobacteriota bacterium]